MTQEQYQWLKDNGYDPAVYDVDNEGNIFENPVAAPSTAKKMSPLRAAGTSFLGSVLPSAAGLYAGAQAGGLGGTMFGPVGSVLGAIGGGLAGGYGAGKLQETALEKLAPEALQELSRAQTEQPVASYLGGFAPNALALRPSLGGLRGLSSPLMSFEKASERSAFMPAAVNVGANVAGATAGQLVNLAEGGEFSAPRFAADVALGSLFSDPTRIGRRLGLQPLTPEVQPTERTIDVEGSRRAQAEALAQQAEIEGVPADKRELFKTKSEMDWWMQPEGARMEQIKDAAKSVKARIPKNRLGELAASPEIYEVIQNPAKFPEFLGNMADQALEGAHEAGRRKTGYGSRDILSPEEAQRQREWAGAREQEAAQRLTPEYLAQAMGAGRERAAALGPEGGVRMAPEGWTPEAVRPARAAATTEEVLGRPPAVEEGMSLAEATKPTPEEVAKAEKIQAENARIESEQNAAELRKLQDLEAAQALSDEAAARLEALQSRQAELNRLAERAPAVVRRGVAEQNAPEIAQAKQELADARAIAEDLYSRLQRKAQAGEPITQADIDAAAELAARRGLRLVPAGPDLQAKGVRGAYVVDADGNRVIYIDPLAATRDTAIHEIGHDVFKTSAAERMQKSLMQTAEDSPAFKAEYEARLREGKTEAEARNIALEEGVIQAFGEAYPNVKPGEIRRWFNALKASLKSMTGMKLSPEDALAWIHYATTEAVPWKGAVAVKGGEERLQRGQQETPEFKNWFGESKVVNEQGEPLVVYHGTSAPDFTSFRTKTGYNYGPGAYFTPEPIRAGEYAETRTGSRIYPAYVKLENPYLVTSDASVQDIGYKIRKDPANVELLKKLMDKYDARNSDILGNGEIGNAWLREQGYDGIIKQRNRYTEDGFVPEIVEVVAFKPEQVKSATGNRGTFDPSNPDIRYQRSLASEAKTPAEIDYLAKRGGVHATVANDLRAAYNTRDYKQGQWSSKYSKTMALRPEDQVRLLNHLADEFDSGIRSTPAPELREAYDQIRNEYLPGIVSEYNNAGFKVRDTAGLRARGSNPTYFPLHVIADDVKTVLTTQQGSPEFVKLKDDFIKWNTQLKQADGATLQEAQNYAQEKFNESQAITAQRPGIESGIPFSGARKPEGYPLPPSWRSNDIVDMLNKYTRRSATDFAYQKHVESSPITMAALGAKTMVNDQPIPANVLQTTEPIVNDPSVQSILREYRGTPAQKTEGMLQSAGRFVSAATIGTVSKIGDIGTSMFKGLAYLPGSEYIGGLADFTNRIANWSALKERAYASGLNKRDAAENMRQVLGIAEDSTAFMDKAARLLSKATFVNDLESVARTIAQGWGETVIGINKKLALGGDKNATQMLDTLSPDWRTRPDADLAAQVGRLLQGSYDMRQLPASVLEGAAAPYLTWSKWSIGQYNNFLNYAIQPAMQGNMKPLIGQMLIGLLGGGAVSAVQEWMNNREGKDITWKELEAWMQQNQGEIGADGGQLLAQKLLTMAQKMGTFGFAGDLAKMVLDSAAGGTAQGVATMPAMDAIFDVAKRAAAAGKALDDGEDFGLVMKALMKDSLVGHVQVLRVARNWLDEDENLRYDDRRRRRLYDELTGAPSRGGAFTVNYSNLSEREFERGEIGEGTGEEAMSLVSRAREQSTTPEEYASRIRKYKTAQNEIMPSLERQPMKAARYLSWLEGAEEGAGAETMRRYMIREQENKYRKSLIEGLSGLR